MRIERIDPGSGDQTSLVRVPLSYSGRDRNLLRVDIAPMTQTKIRRMTKNDLQLLALKMQYLTGKK